MVRNCGWRRNTPWICVYSHCVDEGWATLTACDPLLIIDDWLEIQEFCNQDTRKAQITGTESPGDFGAGGNQRQSPADCPSSSPRKPVYGSMCRPSAPGFTQSSASCARAPVPAARAPEAPETLRQEGPFRTYKTEHLAPRLACRRPGPDSFRAPRIRWCPGRATHHRTANYRAWPFSVPVNSRESGPTAQTQFDPGLGSTASSPTTHTVASMTIDN